MTFSAAEAPANGRLRWHCNGRLIAQAEGPTLMLANVGTIASGVYSIAVDGPDGAFEQEVANLTVVAETHFTDFAADGCSGSGARALILGFVIDGAGAKGVLLRGSASAGSAHPEITLLGTEPIGDLSLPPGTEEAALLTHLDTGGYTLRVTDPADALQMAHAGVIDADKGESSDAVIVNASARAFVTPDQSLQLAFALAGSTAGTVLIRGIGPSLRSLFGVTEALSQVRIELRDEEGALVRGNEDWQQEPQMAEAFARCGAFALKPDSVDAALLVTLSPGTYRANLTSQGAEGGIGLIEIYQVPTQ